MKLILAAKCQTVNDTVADNVYAKHSHMGRRKLTWQAAHKISININKWFDETDVLVK